MPPKITTESKNVTKENYYILNKLEECICKLKFLYISRPLLKPLSNHRKKLQRERLTETVIWSRSWQTPYGNHDQVTCCYYPFFKPKMNCLYPHILSLNELFFYFYKLTAIDFSVLLHKSTAEYPITESDYNCSFAILSIKTIPHKSLFRVLYLY